MQLSRAIRSRLFRQGFRNGEVQDHKVRTGVLTYFTALKACIRLRDLDSGRIVHSGAVESGNISDVFLASSLVSMYAKCGSMVEARRAFESIPRRDVVCWNALLLGYAENGEEKQALDLFAGMEGQGCAPNSVSVLAAVKACCELAGKESGQQIDGKIMKAKSLEMGRAVHFRAVNRGCESENKVANSLIDMYAKCGSMVEARRVFDKLSSHTAVSWTALMLGYIDNGEADLALDCFQQMQSRGCLPDDRAFVAALKACTSVAEKQDAQKIDGKLVKLSCLETGMAIHSQAVQSGCSSNDFVASALVDMYANCGSLLDARRVFDRMACHDDVVVWNALMQGYVENGEAEVAVQLFDSMQLKGCATPNGRTYAAVLKACISLAAEEQAKELHGKNVKLCALEKGMAIHSQAASRGFESDTFISRALVTLYANCGSLIDARMVFNRMPHRDLISWTVLILGYASNGEAEAALECLELMRREGFTPDAPTFVAALKACRNLELSRMLHADINRHGVEDDSTLVTCLIDVYGKCGSMVNAQQVFDSLGPRSSSIVTWTALLAGYGRNGDTEQVLNLFQRIKDEGLQMCSTTLLCVLTACSHAGLIETGRKIFQVMLPKFGIQPGAEHYTCMIDLLCRANEVEAAVAMVDSMPYKPSAVAWTIILAACEKRNNLEIGKRAFDSLLSVEHQEKSSYAYVLMRNIYRAAGMVKELEAT